MRSIYKQFKRIFRQYKTKMLLKMTFGILLGICLSVCIVLMAVTKTSEARLSHKKSKLLDLEDLDWDAIENDPVDLKKKYKSHKKSKLSDWEDLDWDAIENDPFDPNIDYNPREYSAEELKQLNSVPLPQSWPGFIYEWGLVLFISGLCTVSLVGTAMLTGIYWCIKCTLPACMSGFLLWIMGIVALSLVMYTVCSFTEVSYVLFICVYYIVKYMVPDWVNECDGLDWVIGVALVIYLLKDLCSKDNPDVLVLRCLVNYEKCCVRRGKLNGWNLRIALEIAKGHIATSSSWWRIIKIVYLFIRKYSNMLMMLHGESRWYRTCRDASFEYEDFSEVIGWDMEYFDLLETVLHRSVRGIPLAENLAHLVYMRTHEMEIPKFPWTCPNCQHRNSSQGGGGGGNKKSRRSRKKKDRNNNEW